MNYGLYIFAAYIITFIVIGWMVWSSFSKFSRLRREVARSKPKAHVPQEFDEAA